MVSQGGSNATTGCVAADDDVSDLEILDGVLDDRQRVDVGWDENIGNVAVAEDISRLKSEDGGLRTA